MKGAAIVLAVIGLILLVIYFTGHRGPGYIYYNENGSDKIMHVKSYSPYLNGSGRIVTDDGETIYFQNIYEYYSDEYIQEK